PDAAEWRRTRRGASIGAKDGSAHGCRPSAARLRLWRDRRAAVWRIGAGAGDGARLWPRLLRAHRRRALAGARLGRRLFLGRRLRHLFLDRSAGATDRIVDDLRPRPAAALPLSVPTTGLRRFDPLARPALALSAMADATDIAYASALELSERYRRH